MTQRIDPYAVALAVVSALDSVGAISTIGGSIASSFAGEPRSTIDIDIVAALEEQSTFLLPAARRSTNSTWPAGWPWTSAKAV